MMKRACGPPTYLVDPERPGPGHNFSLQHPTVVAILNAVIATVGVPALSIELGVSGTALVFVCVVVFSSCSAGLFMLQVRAFNTARRSEARFPANNPT